eukprot:gnl/TRDRNA2_/TRDRNA2_172142_c0_seq1.p1 gnl/TRDRNA2_/TRDRNA2_172142_c0~~gnl/TRDRNA2_/TRDRNA2_172142_c0_seq1.p1  ORF type:complete len:490 (-),score=55.61 gnl/TRDRNA2_/TRDRNA2_172142_c0_seq1:111-1580(-)
MSEPTHGEKKKKLLFLTIPLQGHLLFHRRLMEWFMQRPEKYELHVLCKRGAPLIEGIHRHHSEAFPGEPELEAQDAAWKSKDAVDAMALYVARDEILYDERGGPLTVMVNEAMACVRSVCPDLVVSDHGYGVGNYLFSCLHAMNIPMVQITTMGRPETSFTFGRFAKLIVRYPLTVARLIRAILRMRRFIVAEAMMNGSMPLLPEKEPHLPINILPSEEALVEQEVPVNPSDFFTGPFLQLPARTGESFLQGRPLDEFPDIQGDLKTFLSRTASEKKPLVYVAFGTVVKPIAEFIHRIVDALDGGSWNILWALPAEQQHLLPRKLSDQWHVMSFTPQFSVLQSGLVGCFLSHCGHSSMTESLAQGVPLVCMPFFGDQFEWAVTVSQVLNAGLEVQKFAEASKIRDAVAKVLDTPLYRTNATAVGERMAKNADARLSALGVTRTAQTRVGVNVTAAIIEACLAGNNPRTALPPTLRPGGLRPGSAPRSRL